MNTTFTELKNLITPVLAEYVSEKRARHIVAVAEEAVRMCEKIGREDIISEAVIAALLHDITKEFSPEEHEKVLASSNDGYSPEEIGSPGPLHALTGAIFAKQLFPELVSEGVYSAIRFHCTGKEAMTTLEKVVYVADFIEATRTYAACVATREAFYADSDDEAALDRAVIAELTRTVNKLKEAGEGADPRTAAALIYYTEKERNMENMNPKDLAIEMVKILNEKNAQDIKLMRVGDKTTIADYFLLCTGMSNTQVKGYADEIEYKLGLKGIEPHHIEGFGEGSWIVLDYSSVIVHVFYKEARDFYSLDKVWADAEDVDISDLITEK